MVVKHCCYGICRSDSRYVNKDHMKGVNFIAFPNPNKDLDRCRRWVRACGRENFDVKNVTKDTFICTLHFVGGNGPSEQHPDPMPATLMPIQAKNTSKKKSTDMSHLLKSNKPRPERQIKSADEPQQKCHGVHNKPTPGQQLDKFKDYVSCSPRREGRTYADIVKICEISESQSLNLPPPLLSEHIQPGAKKVSATNSMTTDMKAQSTASTAMYTSTGTKSKTPTASQDLNQSFTLGPRDQFGEEVPHPSPLDGTVQLETNSTDEVPTVTTNSITTNDYTSEMFLKEVSSMRLNSVKPLDAKEAVVNYTCPVCGSIGVLTGISTSIGPATYPDGGMADKMPGEARAKPLPERSNGEILRFYQVVSGWTKGRFIPGLETNRTKIVNNNWIQHICRNKRGRQLYEAMREGRPEVEYNGKRVRSLLRFIRNVDCHYNDLHEDVQTAFGTDQDEILDFFRDEFPLLLGHVYNVMQQFDTVAAFKSYYPTR